MAIPSPGTGAHVVMHAAFREAIADMANDTPQQSSPVPGQFMALVQDTVASPAAPLLLPLLPPSPTLCSPLLLPPLLALPLLPPPLPLLLDPQATAATAAAHDAAKKIIAFFM